MGRYLTPPLHENLVCCGLQSMHHHGVRFVLVEALAQQPRVLSALKKIHWGFETIGFSIFSILTFIIIGKFVSIENLWNYWMHHHFPRFSHIFFSRCSSSCSHVFVVFSHMFPIFSDRTSTTCSCEIQLGKPSQ